jgi:flagellar hook-basal body complex protein FliE
MPIDPLSAATLSLPQAGIAGSSGAGAGSRFTQALHKLLDASEKSSADANQKVASMMDGSGDVHEAMIALQRAELSLQLTVQVRNKLMSAYQDIMRMPV